MVREGERERLCLTFECLMISELLMRVLDKVRCTWCGLVNVSACDFDGVIGCSGTQLPDSSRSRFARTPTNTIQLTFGSSWNDRILQVRISLPTARRLLLTMRIIAFMSNFWEICFSITQRYDKWPHYTTFETVTTSITCLPRTSSRHIVRMDSHSQN